MPEDTNGSGSNVIEDIDIRRRRMLQTVGAAGITGIAGCTGGDSTPTSGTEGDEPAGGTGTEGDESPASGEGAQTTAQYALLQSIVALDFSMAYDFTTNNVTNPIWDTLVSYTFDPIPEVEPGLASNVEQVSETTYEYTLKDATFHNGDTITAEDVKASFERIRNPDMTSPLGWALGNVKSGDEGLVAVDEETFQVNLKEKSAVWQYMPAFMGIGPKSVMEEHGKDFGRQPGTTVGSGPYQVENWSQGSEIRLSKFEDFRDPDAAEIDEVVFKVTPEGAGRVTGLKTDSVDVSIDIPPQQWQQVNNLENAEMKTGSTYLVYQLSFQNSKDPWNGSRKLKQALSYATDWNEIIETVYYGKGKRLKGPLPQNMPFHNSDLDYYEYDPEKAKQLFNEAGGLDQTIDFITQAGTSSRVAVLVQQMWEEVLDVDMEIRKMPYEQLLPELESGNFDVLMNGWGSDYPDPDGILYAQYHSDNWPPGNNESFYKNEEVDELLTEARHTLDEQEREELYKEAQEIIHRDASSIWGIVITKGFGVSTDIEFPDVTPMWYWQDLVSNVNTSGEID